MAEVTIRELRNHGGEVVDRVAAGERLVVTRSGKRVAKLRPLPTADLRADDLLRRWRRLPRLDEAALRADVDGALDPSV